MKYDKVVAIQGNKSNILQSIRLQLIPQGAVASDLKPIRNNDSVIVR